MSRSNRLFEIIQALRAASGPVTADMLAERLEVSARTIYRDIVALQSMRIPVEGEAGVGYLMRSGYDLPPLNFDEEEVEALRVGLSMLARSGDGALQRAAMRICAKVDDLREPAEWLQVAPWGAPLDDPEKGCVPTSTLRNAIRSERKLRIVYRDARGEETERTVRPVGLVYHLECVMLAAWCELRQGFRHFRADRLYGCEELEDRFVGQGAALLALWRELNAWAPECQPVDAKTAA